MKIAFSIFKLLLISTLLSFTSCSEDDVKNDEYAGCLETEVRMIVDGEQQIFYTSGRGIDSRTDGYELQISIARDQQDPFAEQNIGIYLPYKATGENIVERFTYFEYKNNTLFSGDFVSGALESNVLTNTKYCFVMTFSGKLSDGNREVIITNGKISYMYEQAFSQ